MTRAVFPLFLVPLAVAACVAAPEAPPAPSPAAARPAAPAPVPAGVDWQDQPVTPGAWRYQRRVGGSEASIGPAGQLMRIGCDTATRRVVLSTGGGLRGAVTIRTSSTTRLLSASGAEMVLAATDPLLDAIAFSRGRFTVEQPGAVALVLPVQAEIGRVVEDCRG